jgi:DNA-binding SARP family transcriptional activator/predicted ATPase
MALTIRLLGVPEVRYGDLPLAFRTRKVLALLIYLVVEGGMYSRESLAALLWPETESQKAAVTLRGTLSRLRQALQPAGNVLIAEAGKVGIATHGRADLDLDWLAAALTAAPDTLAPILELDRGEFLAGFTLPDCPDFDAWVTLQRQTCQGRVEAVYEMLSEHQLQLGSGLAAAETAARWLARAPYNESAYRRLMAAQALSGNRAAALATYARCQEILRTELGIAPARETVDLAGRIRSEAMPAAPLPASNPSPALLPFTGRAEEHRRLVAAFRQAVAGGARAALVIGAGGVGKTRLVQSFLEWVVVDTPGVDIWQGRAFEMGGSLAYEPLVVALRPRLERENAPEDLLEDVWLAELSQLMPELRGRYPDLPPPMSGDGNFVRSRLFAAVATLGGALAARQPAVLILDDIQWADADTRDMVHYVARRWAENNVPILLLLAVRQEDYAGDTALRDRLSRLERDVPVTRLLLDALSGVAVQTLIAGLAVPGAGAAATRAFAEWIWAETSGLPFFIEALLQMLVEQDVLTTPQGNNTGYDFSAALQHVHSVTRVPLPPGVRDVILARLDHLGEVGAALLLAAALLGRECSYLRLCRVAGVDELAALPALEALLNGRLLAETGPARRPYVVAHDHIREVVYDQSSAARRRVLHRRALIDLEAAGAPAAECAFHAVASLLDEPAFRHSLAAGDEALARHALQESLAHYDRALEAAQKVGTEIQTLPSESLCRLYQNRGRVLELTYQHEAALSNYHELASLAETLADRALAQAALTALCIIRATHNPVFNSSLARELGAAALELAQELGDQAAEAKALWCMMLVEFHAGGDRQKVLDYGEQSLALARKLGLKEQMGFALTNLSWAYATQEQIAAARAANAEALTIWRELGNLPMVADSYTMKMAIQRLAGEYDGLLAAAHETLTLSEAIGNTLHQSMALLSIGDVHCAQGRYGHALADYAAAVAIAQASGDDLSLQGIYSSLILVYLLVGALEEAEQWADKLYATSRESTMPVFQVLFLARIARAKIARGKLGEGEAVLKQAWATFSSAGSLTYAMAELYVADGHLQLALGHAEKALEREVALIRHLQQIGGRDRLAEAYWLKGRACRALAQVMQAQEAFGEARALAGANRERSILWPVLLELAQMVEEDGDSETAHSLNEQAREVVDYIADHMDDPELRQTFLERAAVRACSAAAE